MDFLNPSSLYFMYFIFVPYVIYHNFVECCIKAFSFCILASVLYSIYICWKRKSWFPCTLFQKKQKLFSDISSCHIFIVYMELRHFCLHVGTRDSWIRRHSFWSIDQASTCPTVGARCYQLFCTIVGLPEEPPVDRLVQSLIPVYQLIRLLV